jgi:hypothetical protein
VFVKDVAFLLCFRYSVKELGNEIRYKVDVNARVSQILIAVLLNIKLECVV